MSDTHIHRRTFLKGLGTIVALPVLEAMLPSTATAASAAATSPVRMAFLFVPNGMSMPQWTPTAEGALQLPDLLSSLAPVQKSLNVLTGLSQFHAEANGDGPGDHARSSAAWLTGVQPKKTSGGDIHLGVSVDQIAAKEIGKSTRFASLELGCERAGQSGDCDSGYSCAYSSNISWKGETTPVAKETNPRLVFERLFGTGDEDSRDSKALRQLSRRSILDFVSEDTNSLLNRVGSRDRQKLDEYLTAVRELEVRILASEKNANLYAKEMKQIPTGVPADRREHIRLIGDMMILAFQTDLTRVSTFMFANEAQNRAFPECGVTEGHHEVSHHGTDPQKLARKLAIDRFHIEQLAYILQKMDSIKEPGGSLLDNTMLVYGAGISDGDRHNHDMLPVLVAGKAGGRLAGGRHIVYPDHTPMNNLYMSMLDFAGVHHDKFGDATGNLQGLF